jgi:S-adenosylmethionine hydrolase
LGPEVSDFVRLPFAAPFQRDASTLVAAVIHVDRFGNCVTNVTPHDLGGEPSASGASLVVGGHRINSFRRFFADDAGAEGEPFAVWGSAGLLEIAVFRDSAARLLGLGRGSELEVVLARAG